jgi:hypothetical protein
MTAAGEKPVPSDDKLAEIIILTVDVEKVARSFGLSDRYVAALDRMIAKGKPVMDKDGMIVLFKREPGTRSPAPSAQGDPRAAR